MGDVGATALALIVHELATNAIKHGALSRVGGTLGVACSVQHRDVVLIWTERGGPPVTAPRSKGGFGSNLVAKSVSGQLGGTIEVDWASDGIVATVRMDKDRLAA